MKRLLTQFVVPAVSVIAMSIALFGPAQPSWAGDSPATATTGAPEPPPGAAVFEMKYRGLSGPADSLSYAMYWGFGAPDDDTGQKDPFVLAVRNRVKECTLVYYRSLSRAQWSVVELKDKKPVAFYFDLNADGRLSDDEKFLPAAPSGSNSGCPFAFVTSDFLIRTDDRREIPFRVMLVGNDNGAELSYIWSPACVLEGQATLAGQPMRLVLFSNRFSGSFTDFGQCDIMLLPAEQKLEGYIPRYMRNTLSSLFYHRGAFYRLKLQGTHTKDSMIRAVLEKDTSPTGQAAFEVTTRDGLTTRLTTIWLQGAKDATIQLHLENAQPTLPIGQYKVSYGDASYGSQSNGEWNVSIKNGPPFDIKAAEPTRVSLGQPVLSVKAIDEKDRYTDSPKERSTYAKGTSIYLSPQIKGKAGEVYTQFARKNTGNNSFTSEKPHVTVRDPDGKTVASTDMEYG
jgi:hypothetical protein